MTPTGLHFRILLAWQQLFTFSLGGVTIKITMPGGRRGLTPGNEPDLDFKIIKIAKNEDGLVKLPEELSGQLDTNNESASVIPGKNRLA